MLILSYIDTLHVVMMYIPVVRDCCKVNYTEHSLFPGHYSVVYRNYYLFKSFSVLSLVSELFTDRSDFHHFFFQLHFKKRQVGFSLMYILSHFLIGTILRRWKKNWFDLWSDGRLIFYDDQQRRDMEDEIHMRVDCINIRNANACRGQTLTLLVIFAHAICGWIVASESFIHFILCVFPQI